ncbi:MAG: hypothetical protein KGZ75_02450 [Syntrophomonadaceae bacterium]|nr:hypothetical protein [Syntrophomonadaceae bacterium]
MSSLGIFSWVGGAIWEEYGGHHTKLLLTHDNSHIISEALAAAIGEAHRRYTLEVNFLEGWSGHLWQGRFSTYPMDEYHLYACARYVELNPVRAGLVSKAWQYRWSSAAAHVEGRDDILLKAGPLLEMIGDWREYLSKESSDKEIAAFERVPGKRKDPNLQPNSAWYPFNSL